MAYNYRNLFFHSSRDQNSEVKMWTESGYLQTLQGRIHSLLLSASGGSRRSLACGCITLIFAPVFTWLSPALLASHLLYLIGTLVIGFSVIWSNLG